MGPIEVVAEFYVTKDEPVAPVRYVLGAFSFLMGPMLDGPWIDFGVYEDQVLESAFTPPTVCKDAIESTTTGHHHIKSFSALLPSKSHDVDAHFLAWATENGRKFVDTLDVAHSRAAFEKTHQHLKRHRSDEVVLGHNRFSDKSLEELEGVLLGYKPSGLEGTVDAVDMVKDVQVAGNIDWRTSGCVPPIMDQSTCGSCYAWSAAGAMDMAHCIKHQKDLAVGSVQMIVDCVSGYQNTHGCDGGDYQAVWQYLIDNYGGKLMLNRFYGYMNADGYCRARNSDLAPAKVTGFANIPVNDTVTLLKHLSVQPVSVSVAVGFDFLLYQSGTLSCESTTMDDLNHAVLLVGVTDTQYIIKNSWSKDFGKEGGYVYISREKGKDCGVALAAAAVVVA